MDLFKLMFINAKHVDALKAEAYDLESNIVFASEDKLQIMYGRNFLLESIAKLSANLDQDADIKDSIFDKLVLSNANDLLALDWNERMFHIGYYFEKSLVIEDFYNQ